MFDDMRKDDAPAVITGERTYTYLRLMQLGKLITGSMNERDLCLLLCRNKAESIAAYVGMISKRVIPIMYDGRNKQGPEEILDKYRPEYICTFEKTEYIGYRLERTVGKLNVYVQDNKVRNDLSLSLPDKRIHIDDELAILLPTSGTTGSSKYVRISYSNMESNTDSIIDALHITDSDITVTSMPMSYTYGLSVINTYLTAGAVILVTEKSSVEKKFWDFFKENKGTSFSAVPYVYSILVKMGFLNMHIPSLKVLTQAGGRLGEELQEKIGTYAKFNDIRLYIMYGQTEATARMTCLDSGEVLNKLGSVGKPVKGGSICIENDYGVKCKTGNIGNIIYKGPNVSFGYADERKDLIRGDENMGRLDTGDMGFVDEAGYLYITGRKSGYAKVCGLRINLRELEERLSAVTGSYYLCKSDDEYITIIGEEEITPEKISEITGIDKRIIRYRNVVNCGVMIKGV